MYKGVVTDLDGTLLNSKSNVSEYTKQVITKLVEKGIKFYIATGRNYDGAKNIMEKLNLDIPLVTSNGARITDSKGNEIYSNNLKKKYRNKILQIDYKKIDKDIILNGYSGDEWNTVEEIEKKLRDAGYELLEKPICLKMKDFRKKEFNKLFYLGEHEPLLKMEKLIKSLCNEEVNVVFVNNHCLEVFSKNCDKSKGAEILLKKDGLTLDDVVAFGDGYNDYELLKNAKKGYIMGNAIDRLINALPNNEIILTNEEDGEAKKLEEIFFKEN